MRPRNIGKLAAALTLPLTFVAASPASSAERGNAGIDSGWVELAEPYRGAGLTYDVRGALANRPGNAHRVEFGLALGEDEGFRLQLSDFRCPAGTADILTCPRLARETAYDHRISVMRKVGRLGLDVEMTFTTPKGVTYPVRLTLRPGGPAWESLLAEPFEGSVQEVYNDLRAQQVTATGRLGPLALSAPNATQQRAGLQTIIQYFWSGPAPRPATGRTTAPSRTNQPPTWIRQHDWRDSFTTWRRAGTVPGRPGTWHTGWTNARITDDAGDPLEVFAYAEWNDWSCPAGVTPPDIALKNSPCTLLRTDRGYSTQLTGSLEGTYGLRVAGRIPTRVITPAGTSRSSAPVDVTLRPAGERTIKVYVNENRKLRAVYSTAAEPAGRMGSVDFGAVTQVRSGHLAVTTYRPG